MGRARVARVPSGEVCSTEQLGLVEPLGDRKCLRRKDLRVGSGEACQRILRRQQPREAGSAPLTGGLGMPRHGLGLVDEQVCGEPVLGHPATARGCRRGWRPG